ncbi:endoribonuclease Dicer homolog 3a isoform X1 [Lycium barbarum]|uniref:endoribonuclease Dicer homolog 3a isoform X1 n=2 Tax=Lycium barbarum TaxID=112863 RepID=UPI00293EB8A2|nr:endoribonuclease Dicer homolog 3a isoform X1 [Lycium barbarum]
MEDNQENPLKRNFQDFTSQVEKMDVQKNKKKKEEFIPREYQLEVFKVAMKRNTIAVLDTGAGKTNIAVMMIREIGKTLRNADEKKFIVFLAPTVHLVHQQYEVIQNHTHLAVQEYYGAKGVDEWTAESWKKETDDNDVLVMTPQILLDALRKGYIKFERVCFLILDECHRASGNHPYTRIMMEFYHRSGKTSKVFGMTASPVIRKGVSSSTDCEEQISELESLLDSQTYALENRTELDEFVPSAKETCKFYGPIVSSNTELKAKLEFSRSKFDAALAELQLLLPNHYKDTDDVYKKLQKRLSNSCAKMVSCLENLGIICAYEAVKICLENVPDDKEENEILRKSSLQHRYFLEDALSIIQESMPQDYESLLDIGYDSSATLSMGHISSKLHVLLEIFESLRKATQLRCLIFVERIITAKVIERVLKKMTWFSHFTIAYVTGTNTSIDALTPKVQKETLESFRSGKVNLLFATDVVEEGIDVPHCSSVIRFDLPKTVRSYVQSRGRARQTESQYILMLERGNMKQREQMFNIIRSEYSMADTAIKRDPDSCVLKPCLVKETNAYYVEATGASVTADSSVSLLTKYCEMLPGDKFFSPKPMFQYILSGDLYQCNLTLPPNAAFQTISGPQCRSTQLSRQLVCLDACKKLHQIGALNDHLLPFNEKPPQSDSDVQQSKLGAGTTKLKELHGTACVSALSGTWGDSPNGEVYQVYKMDFPCNIMEVKYSSFVLLLQSELDDDVGNVEVELFLVSKFVKSAVAHCGKVHLDAQQVAKAKIFQELFFNGLFGKLFIKSSDGRKFLLETEETLWKPSNMYLLLPLDPLDSGCEPYRVDWGGIESSASVVEFLKRNAWLSAEKSEAKRQNSLVDRTASFEVQTDLIHFANISICRSKLKNMVVVAIHTGRIYSVVDAVANSSSESPFEVNSEATGSPFSSYADYFHKKYGIVLVYPGQPMLLMKQSHNAFNLLVDFKKEGISCGKEAKDRTRVVQKPQNNVHMPPELLVCIDIRIDILKSFYLLPSLMHRLESLMLASQLRKEITSHSGDLHISSSLILEALTTLRCNESFSMERLELLGDSVLKYAVSCHLFLKYPKKHEGQLTGQRSQAVSNSALHKLGTNQHLQSYIRDGAFDPGRWTAPGQLSIRSCPCEHGVETPEVPLGKKFLTEAKVVVGKHCDRGHRWMGSKTISDCVEALIGAYYVGGGFMAALKLMKWLGVKAELEPSLVEDAINTASLYSYTPKAKDIEDLELKLDYKFSVKGLLLEAITHATVQELDVAYSYQRLEFLGDSVLDILITWYLYQKHKDIDPGELTDLRSASVNNDNFAYAAVKRELHVHLQHRSGYLESEISSFVKSVSNSCSLQGNKAPKVLGDLVESIAGAILIDTKLNLDEVWKIFEPLLSPIVTPDKLELPPLRELIELCDSLGYFLKDRCVVNEDTVHAELRLQLKDELLVAEGSAQTRKTAKGQAAMKLLKDLEKRGISSKKKKEETSLVDVPHSLGSDGDICSQVNTTSPEMPSRKKQKTICLDLKPDEAQSVQSDCSSSACYSNKNIQVIGPINMKRGGPRISLFELCKKLQWPMPSFESVERKSKSLIECGEGPDKRKVYNTFASQISLTIPDYGLIELTGDERADKKSSLDSASLLMLYELERRGKIVIGK